MQNVRVRVVILTVDLGIHAVSQTTHTHKCDIGPHLCFIYLLAGNKLSCYVSLWDILLWWTLSAPLWRHGLVSFLFQGPPTSVAEGVDGESRLGNSRGGGQATRSLHDVTTGNMTHPSAIGGACFKQVTTLMNTTGVSSSVFNLESPGQSLTI